MKYNADLKSNWTTEYAIYNLYFHLFWLVAKLTVERSDQLQSRIWFVSVQICSALVPFGYTNNHHNNDIDYDIQLKELCEDNIDHRNQQ